MKKIVILLLLAIMFSANLLVLAGDGNVSHADKYCAKMKDGMLKVMYEGSAITANVVLEGGTTIKTDGTIIRKDGSTVTLKEGECIDKSGKITPKKKSEPYK